MDYVWKTLHDCSGGKIFSQGIPNRLTSHHYSNVKLVSIHLLPSFETHKVVNEHGISSWLHLYCDMNGKLEAPDAVPRKIPNVVIKTFHNQMEGPQNTIYQIFSNPDLSEKAVYELVRTELELNHKRIKSMEHFVTEKLKMIKQDRGFWEALRWAKTYEQVAETKQLASMWSIYWI